MFCLYFIRTVDLQREYLWTITVKFGKKASNKYLKQRFMLFFLSCLNY